MVKRLIVSKPEFKLGIPDKALGFHKPKDSAVKVHRHFS